MMKCLIETTKAILSEGKGKLGEGGHHTEGQGRNELDRKPKSRKVCGSAKIII